MSVLVDINVSPFRFCYGGCQAGADINTDAGIGPSDQ